MRGGCYEDMEKMVDVLRFYAIAERGWVGYPGTGAYY
jgi:hypothetical protein